MKKDIEKIFEEMFEEYEFDCKFTIDNLSDKSLMIPSLKHKWVGKYMRNKFKLLKLKENKDKLQEALSKNIASGFKVKMNEKEIQKIRIEGDEKLNELIEKIKETELIQDYLQMLVNNFTYIASDIKNMIDMQKLETL